MKYKSERDIWRLMKNRCGNPSAKDYPRYGGRGIQICEQWNNFDIFLSDVGPRPSKLLSLERCDNDGNYEPGNVRWATAVEQQNNKRTNHRVLYMGEMMSVADAVRLAGSVIGTENAAYRIRNGWPVEAAVETPPLFRRDPTSMKVIEGKHRTRVQAE
jgi:hypothetical protein